MATHSETDGNIVFETLNRHGEKIAKLEAGSQHMATKADIRQLETKIEQLRADLTWRIVIAMGAMTAVFTFIVEQRIGDG